MEWLALPHPTRFCGGPPSNPPRPLFFEEHKILRKWLKVLGVAAITAAAFSFNSASALPGDVSELGGHDIRSSIMGDSEVNFASVLSGGVGERGGNDMWSNVIGVDDVVETGSMPSEMLLACYRWVYWGGWYRIPC